jgi:hypothetical protein
MLNEQVHRLFQILGFEELIPEPFLSRPITAFICDRFNYDGFLKSRRIVMPDLIRHPEPINITGFRLSPE